MDTPYYWNGSEVSKEQFYALLEASQEAAEIDIGAIQGEFQVSRETAEAIHYLRSRSRWTIDKENELIRRDHNGNPIKLEIVLSGGF